MFDKLIEELCQKEGLIDIGSFGVATQSSTSKWSRENDAQRAVSNLGILDYAFHTDKEENPWWQIDFEKPKDISYIIISNRKRKPFNEIASRLLITALNEEGEDVVLHSGDLCIGSLPDTIPLILPVSNINSIKNIKITLLKNDYLHLADVKFLSKKELLIKGKRNIFISDRTDGLGERLKALLNSMILAKEFSGEFLFTWQPHIGVSSNFHSISEGSDIFSKDFLLEHMIEKETVNKLNTTPVKSIKDINSKNVTEKDAIIVQQQFINNQLNFKGFEFHKEMYKKRFNEIVFSERVEIARSSANSLDVSDKIIAIHLRSGDIIYGMYRFMDRYYNKVIPFYLLDSLIDKLKAQGYEILIFGQEESFCKYISNKYNLLYSSNLAPNYFDDLQMAIFDIVLMSRCSGIISGGSGFSILAGWVGGVSNKYFDKYLTNEEIKKSFAMSIVEGGILENEIITPLMKAFSIAHFLVSYEDNLSLDCRIELIQQCVAIDSENTFYKIIQASFYYEKGDNEKADFILYQEIEKNKDYDIEWISKTIHPDKTTTLLKFVPTFEDAASQGSVVALTVVLLHEYYYLKNVDFTYYKNIVYSLPKNTLGLDTLETKIKKFS